MDASITAAIIGGLITGLLSVGAVWLTNSASAKQASADRKAAAAQAGENARLARSGWLASELGRLRDDLKSVEVHVAWDALDELKALMARVNSPVYTDDDRRAVWRLLQSRTAARAAAIQQYPQQQPPRVQVRHQP